MVFAACLVNFIGAILFWYFALTVGMCSLPTASIEPSEEMKYQGGCFFNAGLVMLVISCVGMVASMKHGI